MIKWLEKRRIRRNKEIAKAVYQELTASRGWEKFLPPVVLRDKVYIFTENGSIYSMVEDYVGENRFEKIIQIRTGP